MTLGPATLDRADTYRADIGPQMHALVTELFPICRSITGPGLRETLQILGRLVPLEFHEVPSGTQVYDWRVPNEWTIRDACIRDQAGRRVVDFCESNLHVVNYSVPVHVTMRLAELRPHLHTLPDHPNWIPYRTSYYREQWGFCLSQNRLLEIGQEYGEDHEFEVRIDASLEPGSLTYGEAYLTGATAEEVLFSCHVCHPSLANDNLSGAAVATYLARQLSRGPRRYSYRFLFVPATIGALAWLSRNEHKLANIRHGLVLTLLGDAGGFTYKRSRRGDAAIDRAVAHVFRHREGKHTLVEFEPYGYDERQYNSPGINLPVGCLMRTPHGRYPEYHTSADDLELVRPAHLAESLELCATIVELLEHDRVYVSRNLKGEPQLGRRGLYRPIGGDEDRARTERALLWVLNQSDGSHALAEIAERAKLPFTAVRHAAEVLVEHGLLREAGADNGMWDGPPDDGRSAAGAVRCDVAAQRAQSAASHACRFCQSPLGEPFVDLGMSPLCESYLSAEQLDAMEPFYPLRAYVCERCWLVQLPQYVGAAEIFGDYAYFSSYSDSWLQHARQYCETMIERFGLGPASQVVEVASNDGYLLRNFVARGIPALGVEPAANVAHVAVAAGVPTLVNFFGRCTADELVADGMRADLLVANNVLAHVPDLNDFVAGMRVLLAPNGVATCEFPHLARLIELNQFDTIYHEHFCYFSLTAARQVLGAYGLSIFDVEELATHGGSLRIFVSHARENGRQADARVDELAERERRAGLASLEGYRRFAEQIRETKCKLLDFLIRAKREGRSIAGYGAPGKGNTLLNYCGIRDDFLDYTVDRNPFKQGKYLPGTHIPVFAPEKLAETKPDYVLILPWNLKDEIMSQLACVRAWGGKFVVPIPEPTIYE
jgi:aminopeptidase-like protein